MTPSVLKEYVQAEFENLHETLDRIRKVPTVKAGNPSDVEVAAISVYAHNIYNGIENIIKLVCTHHGHKIKKTPDWHRELLNSSRDLGIINLEL